MYTDRVSAGLLASTGLDVHASNKCCLRGSLPVQLICLHPENHGVAEAASEADEFQRILKRFDDNLRLDAGKARD